MKRESANIHIYDAMKKKLFDSIVYTKIFRIVMVKLEKTEESNHCLLKKVIYSVLNWFPVMQRQISVLVLLLK